MPDQLFEPGSSADIVNKVEWINTNEDKLAGMRIAARKEYEEKYLDAIDSNIMGMINGLPREDSKDYYRERFAVDLSEKDFKAVVESKTEKELLKFFVDIEMDIN